MTTRSRWAGAAAAALLAFGTGAGRAAATEPAGKAQYEQYCAPCHGAEADGRGPVAPELKQAPTDLRKLGARYGTPLPKADLREFVDGRRMVRAHGTAEMPVWGEKLVDNLPETPGIEGFRRGTIVAILDYLDAIQPKPGTIPEQ